MRWLKHAWIPGAALVALGSYLAFAQPVVTPNMTGNECWNAGQGPGGPGSFVCANVAAGRTGDVALTISGSFTVGAAGTTGVSVTTQPILSGGYLLVTAQPSAATITLPPNPVSDGATVSYCNVTNAAFATNAVTYAANTNQTLATGVPAMTTQAARTCTKVMFNAAAATWYGVQ